MNNPTNDKEAQVHQRIQDLSETLAADSNYERQIWDGIAAAMELLGVDYEYPLHIEAVRTRGVSAASPSDLSTWFTWMSRSERFCEGFLEGKVCDGELAEITERLKALIASGEVHYTPEEP